MSSLAEHERQTGPAHRVEIPLPPSTNGLYRSSFMPRLTPDEFLTLAAEFSAGRKSWSAVLDRLRQRRFKSRAYRDWSAEVAWRLKRLPKIAGQVKLEVQIYGGRGWRENADVSNRIKAIEDAVVSAGKLPTDDCRTVIRASATYFNRLEHLALSGRPTTKAEAGRIVARCELVIREGFRVGECD